jgi:sterol desaturase/sphingolipid hydroxylase (fatty acid hydroxylase superfamily)
MEDLVPVIILGSFLAFIGLERLRPGREQPKVRLWALKGGIAFMLAMAFNGGIPVFFVEVVGGSPLNLTSLGLWGIPLVVFASELANYWVHRMMHTSPFLWRWTHQMHHSAERVDMLGSTYSHPFEIILSVGMSTAVSWSLGIAPEAAAIAGLLGFYIGVFSHLDTRTPRWLGYILQRPEMHSVHHERGVHAYNYAGLPVFDILFGTFRNPQGFSMVYGFHDGASERIGSMLIGRDVAEPGTGIIGAKPGTGTGTGSPALRQAGTGAGY